MLVKTTLHVRLYEINHLIQIKGKDFQFSYKHINEGDINTCFCRNSVRSDVNVSGSVLGFQGRDNSVGIVPKLLDRQEIVVR
jgi:hypothetical protein